MYWKAELPTKGLRLEIRHDKLAGYSLYVWKNGKGIHDDLQDTLEIAKCAAFDDFDVPIDSWKHVEETN